MDITLRLEEEKDHRSVEELTREAFWNLHVPGCSEHLVAHRLRESSGFIPGLDFVALEDGVIVGNIMYSRAKVMGERNDATDVITFGPLSVLPQRQNRGIGSMLIRHTLEAAAGMGYRAAIIFGDPLYYHRFGFKAAKEYGISTPDGRFMEPHMALELRPGALAGVCGRYFGDEAFEVNEEEVAAFDRLFPTKEKKVTETQKRFSELAGGAT
jgi:predicted N-acetyltransferase YhbS